MSDNDYLETIWTQFAIETEEHLDSVEQLLVCAEGGDVGAEGVAQLFRSFHSVKGLAKVMDLLAMERVAHRAEDLLGLVRDGTAALDPTIAALLLEAVDALKHLREKAVAEHADGIAPDDLVERLGMAFAAAGGAIAIAASAALPPDDGGIGLHDDAEMLSFFTEVVRENVPALTSMLADTCAPPTTCEGCDGCERMRGALDTIAHAAGAMGFVRIQDVAADIRHRTPGNGPVSAQERDDIVALLPELQNLIHHIEQESGADAGSITLSERLTATMRSDFEQVLSAIDNDLRLLDTDGNASVDDDEVANALAAKLAAANSFLSFLAPASGCELLLLLEDVFGRVGRGELAIFVEIVELSRQCVSLVRSVFEHAAAPDAAQGGTAVDKTEQELARRIHDYIWAYGAGTANGGNPVEAFRDFIKGLKITPELAEVLSPENARDLMAAMKNGEHLYEILAHLESSDAIAGHFLEWVGKRGTVITNRSVFVGDQNWYEMLMVSKAARHEVAAELAAIDPEQRYLRLTASVDQANVPSAQVSARRAASPASSAAASGNVIRVAGETLDGFMNQIGEMVLVRAQLNHALTDPALAEAMARLKGVVTHYPALMAGRRENDAALPDVFDILDGQLRRLAEVDALIQSSLTRLQEGAMALRVVPVDTVFKRFPRVVRDLAQAQGKRIRLDMVGQEVRIDKAMVEVLSDPLMHMVRNAADHGIEMPDVRRSAGKPEEAQIIIKAAQQGNRVVVQVIDDGRGIDTERVRAKAVERGLVKEEESGRLGREEIFNFLFMPGFSTAEVITETSGRGVGMDVVRTNVLRLGGAIHVHSEPGRGSTFTLEMPLSAAVQEVMMVGVTGQTLAVPARYVAEVIEIEPAAVQSIKGRRAMLLRGSFLPLVYLGDLLGFGGAPETVRHLAAVVVSNGQHTVGIEVDRMIGRRELFVKDIHARLAGLPGVGGASILGNGKVVLILDGEALLKLAQTARPGGLDGLPAAVAA